MTYPVGFTGSRGFERGRLVRRVLDALLLAHPDLFVHVGDARGLDAIVRSWCSIRLPRSSFKVHYARWKTLGKTAGHERNGRVVAPVAVLFAFFDSSGITPGTADAVGQALERGIKVHIWFERSTKWVTIPEGWLADQGCGTLEAWERIVLNQTANSTTAPRAGAPTTRGSTRQGA